MDSPNPVSAGTHNIAVIVDGNVARRRGITDEELFTDITLAIRHIAGVKNVYAYEMTSSAKWIEKLEGHRVSDST